MEIKDILELTAALTSLLDKESLFALRSLSSLQPLHYIVIESYSHMANMIMTMSGGCDTLRASVFLYEGGVSEYYQSVKDLAIYTYEERKRWRFAFGDGTWVDIKSIVITNEAFRENFIFKNKKYQWFAHTPDGICSFFHHINSSDVERAEHLLDVNLTAGKAMKAAFSLGISLLN
jgi:hypothetical protein